MRTRPELSTLLPVFLALSPALRPQAATAAGFEETARTGDLVVHWLAFGIEIAGIAIIVLGVVFTSGRFLASIFRRREMPAAFHLFRNGLGRAILLGLEFLVAADIIGTVAVDPTFQNLGILATIVLIRTFLSFSLEVEIEGKWPWQRDSRTRP